MKEKILDKAGEMFLKYGYKSVTMDDIASEMAISKKTLYKYFDNKENLVDESTSQIHQSCLSAISDITARGFTAIKENLEIKKMFREMFKNVGGSPLFQLKKYYPKVYDKVMSVEVVAFYECIKNNILKGIESGFYRKDLKVDISVDFYMALIFSTHQKAISHSEILKIELEALIYHTRAIATEKGLKELENLLKEN